MKQKTKAQQFLEEVIMYGGLPLQRGDVYLDVLALTGSPLAAELFAYEKPTVDKIPITYEEFLELWQGKAEYSSGGASGG